MGAADPMGFGIFAPWRKKLVWQTATIPMVKASQTRERPRISRQVWSRCRTERRKRFNIAKYSAPATEACLIENSAIAGLLAVKAKWRDASHATITNDKSKKHWFSRRFGL